MGYTLVALYAASTPPAPPGVPSGLRAVGGGRDIALQWKMPSSESGIRHYELYRNGSKIATIKPEEADLRSPRGTRYYDANVSRDQA